MVLSPEEVSARLRPMFAALCEHGFTSAALSSPVRAAMTATAPGAQPTATAPAGLTSLLDKECEAVGMDFAAVTKSIADIRRTLTPREARDLTLAIYATQALADADTGNLHRAHVLLGDTIVELSESRRADLSTALAIGKQFFQEVPNDARLRAFGEQLDRYMLLREEQFILGGEHAAVLSAGGLSQAALVARERLLADMRLVTLPLVDLAIARGDTYGWQPSDAVLEVRDRLKKHVASLADGHEPTSAFLTDVKWANADAERATVTATAKVFSAVFLAGCPMRYDSEQQRLALVGLKSIASDEQLAAAAAWTAGKAVGEQSSDGTGHMLVALHWLSEDRPEAARATLMAGAATLLEAVKAEAAADSDDNATVATMLCRQLNAYRLVAAATMLPASATAHLGSESWITPTEVEIFLLAWRQAWLKAGLPQKPANSVIADATRAFEQRSSWSQATATRGNDRYFFFDYRFVGDGVPEVLVTKAATEELVETSRQPELATSERFLEFLRGFQMPRDFSPGFRTRLQPADR